MLIALVALGAFQWKIHNKMVDFGVYRQASTRVLAGEELFRESDGHFQFKYLPVFAMATVPFAVMSADTAKLVWFGVSVFALVMLVRWAAQFVPERRRGTGVLIGLTLLVMLKFYVHELQLGQVNLAFTLIVVAAIGALQSELPIAAGILFVAAVCVKPYAVLFGPWMLVSEDRKATMAFSAALAVALLLPTIVYGFSGNLQLLWHWWQTVTTTTAPNLLLQDNVSFASVWAKWLGPGTVASVLAILTGLACLGLIADMWRRRGAVQEPAYLEVAALLVLMPLLSPQGWDYVLLLSTPAIVLLFDRELELPGPWRIALWASVVPMGLVIYDLVGRTFYHAFMLSSVVTIGAVMLVVALSYLRRHALA